MYAALSAVSSQGIWILVDSTNGRCVAEVSWTDQNATGLSTEIAPQFKQLLNLAGIQISALQGLWGVSGPGAFTGLRLSSAFLQGLAQARGLPLRSISSFHLWDRKFFIPLRHQKAAQLDLAQALEQGIEFLEIEAPEQATLRRPTQDDFVIGLKDFPNWPRSTELAAALWAQQKAPLGLRIFYGLEPKISGVRSPQSQPQKE